MGLVPIRWKAVHQNVGPNGEHASARRYGMSVARGSGHVVWCRAELPPGAKPAVGFLDACASLQVP